MVTCYRIKNKKSVGFLQDWNISNLIFVFIRVRARRVAFHACQRYSGTRGSAPRATLCNIMRISFPLSIFHRDQSMISDTIVPRQLSCCRYLCSSLLRFDEIRKRNKIYNPVTKWPIRFQRTRLHPLKRRVNAFNFHPRRSIFQVF